MPKRKVEEPEVEEAEEDNSEEGTSGSDSDGGSGSDDGSSSSDGDDDGFPDVSDKGEEDEDDEEGEMQEEIVINFEFFPPKEIDFHGLRSLLTTYLDGQQYDVSGLVNSILKQDIVGSVVKTAEDDDPIAVFTVLNTQTHKEQEWMKQLRAFLGAKAKDDLKQKLSEAFDATGTGLLINERLINSPPKLAPPLMQFLFEEIKSAATDKQASKQQREEFGFKRYLVATRVYADHERKDGADDEAGPSSSKAPAKQVKKPKLQPGEPVLVYLRPEDEFLHKSCSWSFTFPVEGRPVTKDDLQPLRMVMLVEAPKIPAVRKALDAVVDNMAAGHMMA